jgi:hypothetical protein
MALFIVIDGFGAGLAKLNAVLDPGPLCFD